jgi:hypothetical protein
MGLLRRRPSFRFRVSISPFSITLGDWTRLILHQLPLSRKSLKRRKDILVSTSWWEVANHGSAGRPQPGFFRITDKKYFVPYRSQAKNIPYSTSDGLGSDIMWWLGDWTRLILHQLPLPRKSLKRGKDILVSTSWWEVANHGNAGRPQPGFFRNVQETKKSPSKPSEVEYEIFFACDR